MNFSLIQVSKAKNTDTVFAPTVSVSSADLWQTCDLRSRKHGNLQTPGQSQQQNPVNQVNLNKLFLCSSTPPPEAVRSPPAQASIPALPSSFSPSLLHSLLLFFLPRVQRTFVSPSAAETCPSKKRAVDGNSRCLMRLP